jgi:hypothetical protein
MTHSPPKAPRNATSARHALENAANRNEETTTKRPRFNSIVEQWLFRTCRPACSLIASQVKAFHRMGGRSACHASKTEFAREEPFAATFVSSFRRSNTTYLAPLACKCVINLCYPRAVATHYTTFDIVRCTAPEHGKSVQEINTIAVQSRGMTARHRDSLALYIMLCKNSVSISSCQ